MRGWCCAASCATHAGCGADPCSSPLVAAFRGCASGPGEVSVMTTRANGPLAGIAWLRRGFNSGRHNPRAIFGGAALIMVAALIPGFLQAFAHAVLKPGPGAATIIAALATVLAVVLLGPLMGGYLRVVDRSERGEPAQAADVIAPFRNAH